MSASHGFHSLDAADSGAKRDLTGTRWRSNGGKGGTETGEFSRERERGNNCSRQAYLAREGYFNSFSLSHGETHCVTAWLKNGSQYSNRSVNPKSEPEQYKCPRVCM